MSKDIEYLWKAHQKAIVAEVIQAKHCVCHQIGDKFVFRVVGATVREETCESPCLYALGPLGTLGYIVFDRVAAGLETSELIIDHIKCLDTGIECGGVGEILMKVRVE